MEFSGVAQMRAQRGAVWEGLLNPEVLRRCIPGCKSLEQVGADTYQAIIELGVGPVKGTYQLGMELKDLAPPQSYRLVVAGSGGPGFVQAELKLNLQDQGEKTAVHYDVEAEVGGTIAAVGQRVVTGIAKLMAGQFFKALEKEIALV